jgi:hypothetical protein
MEAPLKSTVEEIRQRFEQDVERFSNLETGQLRPASKSESPQHEMANDKSQ